MVKLEDPELTPSHRYIEAIATFTQLTVKMPEDWQKRPSTASHREKVAYKRVRKAEMWLGTKLLAVLIPNRRDITDMERKEDQTPHQALLALRTYTGTTSPFNICLRKPAGLNSRGA